MLVKEFEIDCLAFSGLREMIAAGKYDGCHVSIKNGGFPLVRGFPRQKVFLLDFEQDISDEKVSQHLSEESLEHTNISKLLPFGARYKEEQLRRNILAIGSVATVLNYTTVFETFNCWPYSPCLCSLGGTQRRLLDICHLHTYWPRGYSFLVEKKVIAKPESLRIDMATVVRPAVRFDRRI